MSLDQLGLEKMIATHLVQRGWAFKSIQMVELLRRIIRYACGMFGSYGDSILNP
jgi:hypothetical protein